MCSYAGCVNMNCERCKVKWLECPNCGNRAYILFKNCKSCGAELTEEAKENARILWRQRKEESKKIFEEKLASLKEEKKANLKQE